MDDDTAKRPTIGRPPHEPTAASRKRVEIGAGAGMSHDTLARALKIAPHTLAKHYAEELTNGAAARRMEVQEAVYRQAKKGNVAACRLYLAQGNPPAPPTSDSLEIVAMPSQATGVKAQRNEAAKVAQQGTEWQRLLPSSVQ